MTNKIGKYTILREIGAGGFGSVYLVEADGSQYALKQLSKNNMEPEITERFIREALRVEELRKNHQIDFLVRIYDVLFKHNAFVMEFIAQSSTDFFKASQDHNFIKLLIQAILQLHKIGVVHRDIKPENLRVKESRPVLIDFGIASWWDSRSKIIPTGTKFYSPPEIVCIFDEFKRLQASREANRKLVEIMPDNAKERIRHIKKLHDVYSLGITIGELFNGSLPFNRSSYMDYLDKGNSPDFQNWLKKVPEQFREFIQHSTEFYPDKRYLLPDLIKKLDLDLDENSVSIPEAKEDLYFREGYIECLGCGKETLPPANFCPYCALPISTMALEITPYQSITTATLPQSIRMAATASDGTRRQRLLIDLGGEDFQINLGRNEDKNQVSFMDDNWMSNIHGSLVKEAGYVYYQEGKDDQLPTNPTLINNIPVGKSRIELFSGGFLLLGSTVFQIKKYFGKMQAGSK
jgi:serine/threonine protein kinase